MKRNHILYLLVLLFGLLTAVIFGKDNYAQAQEFVQPESIQANTGTAISYQGSLVDGGAPANGTYYFQFSLYDALTGGNQIDSTLAQTLTVSDGIFNTTLDFGDNAFPGVARYLQIAVGTNGVDYTTLSPRQALTPVPVALSLPNVSTTQSGQVGIGTDAPSATLDVVGDIETTAGMKDFGGGNAVVSYGANGSLNTRLGENGANYGGLSLYNAAGDRQVSAWVGAAGGVYQIYGPDNKLDAELGPNGLRLATADGSIHTDLYVDGNGAGTLNLRGGNGNVNARLGENSANNGGLFLYNAAGHTQANAWVGANGGVYQNYGPDNKLDAELGPSGLRLATADGSIHATLYVTGNDVGTLDLQGENGQLNARLGNNGTNNGRLTLHGPTGGMRTDLSIIQDAGVLNLSGPNSGNVVIGDFSNATDNGYVMVQDDSGTNQAGIYVDGSGNGIVFGDTKSFRMQHPTDPTKEIWYASLEGPEAGAYARGTAQLVNGIVTIPFPEHFALVINPDTVTTMLTPRSADSLGLAVVAQDEYGITVQELGNGQGNYAFDWEVKGVRAGFEDFTPVRDKINPSEATDPETMNRGEGTTPDSMSQNMLP